MIHAGCTPYRWVLESPTNFAEANPISVRGRLQIVYSVNSPSPGVFPFEQFSWVGYSPNVPAASFGCSENSDQETLRFTNVLTEPLVVQITGEGTVFPNYNGHLLEIGKRYSMTATPGLGFVFTNWTDEADQVVTNKPAVIFMMSTNLLLRANFKNVQKPVLTITSPLSDARITNELAKVRGKVTDNGWVESVTCRLNSGDWVTALGTTNWETDLTLQPGTNWFEVYAKDREGLRSATNRVAYFRVVTNRMTVTKQGKGAVDPRLFRSGSEMVNLSFHLV